MQKITWLFNSRISFILSSELICDSRKSNSCLDKKRCGVSDSVYCSLEDEVHASDQAESWLEKTVWLLISSTSLSPLHDHDTSFHLSN